MRVRVIKPFLVGGERREPGSFVDLPDHVVREILWMGKAERAPEAPAKPPEEAPAEPIQAEAPPLSAPARRGRPRRRES